MPRPPRTLHPQGRQLQQSGTHQLVGLQEGGEDVLQDPEVFQDLGIAADLSRTSGREVEESVYRGSVILKD